MISGGYGGANTNLTGLRFERDIDLEDTLLDRGYSVFLSNGFKTGKECVQEVHDSDGLVGYLAPKRALMALLKGRYGVSMNKVLSMNFLPDEAFLNVRENVLHILEKKWQQSSGSVDEKIQTGVFKLHEYQSLAEACSEASGEEITATYDYILSDWFTQERYQDVLDYNEAHGVGCYFAEVPVEALGL